MVIDDDDDDDDVDNNNVFSLFGLMLNVPVNSSGYVEMFSSPNHTVLD